MLRHAFATALRWIVGLALLRVAWSLAAQGHEDVVDLTRVLLGAGAFAIGIGLLWPTLFRLATRPFLAWIDLVFLPGGRLEKPVLNLKLPMHYLNEGRYDEAFAEYRKILKHHPKEPEAYEKMAWIESEIRRRPRRALRWLRLAKRRRVRLDKRIAELVRRRVREIESSR